MEDSLESRFLNKFLGKAVTIYLRNCVKLQGKITYFDNTVVVLERLMLSQLLYLSVVSSIDPSAKYEEERKEGT